MLGRTLPGILAGPIVDMESEGNFHYHDSKLEAIEYFYTFAEGTDMALALEHASIAYDGWLSIRRFDSTGQLMNPDVPPKTDERVRALLAEKIEYTYEQCINNWALIGKVADRLLKKRRLTKEPLQDMVFRHLAAEQKKAAKVAKKVRKAA